MTWIEERTEKLIAQLITGEPSVERVRRIAAVELAWHAGRQAGLEDEANQAYTESLLWSNEAQRLRKALCLVGAFLEKQPALEIPDDVARAIDDLYPVKRTL